MNNKVKSIARNTSYFTFALIMQKIISFSYFLILGRRFVPEEFGRYYAAITITTIFAIFIELGLSSVLAREVARSKERAVCLMSNVFFLKIPLAVVSLVSVVLFVYLMDYGVAMRNLVYLSSVCMILDSFTASFFAFMRGHHNLKYESFSAIFYQLVVLGLGLVVLKLDLGIFWLIGVLVGASIFNFVYSFSLVYFKWKVAIFSYLELNTMKWLIVTAVPFAVFGILQKLYVYMDTVLLSVLAGDAFVGLYQVAFKIVFALQFLPSAFTASLYPAFAAYWVDNREQLNITFERAFRYLIVISMPISVGVIVLADEIIMVFRPEYAAAVPALRVAMSALFFIFINFPVGALLNACDLQKRNTVNMFIVLLLSVAMNIVLIPKYQALGASITVVVTNVLMFTLGMYYVLKTIRCGLIKMLGSMFRVLGVVSCMGAVTYFLKDDVHIFLNVFISALVYGSLLLAVGEVTRRDVASVYNSFSRKV